MQYSVVYSTPPSQVMCVLMNISNASGKSRDALINCDELMRAIAEILVSVTVPTAPLYCPPPLTSSPPTSSHLTQLHYLSNRIGLLLDRLKCEFLAY